MPFVEGTLLLAHSAVRKQLPQPRIGKPYTQIILVNSNLVNSKIVRFAVRQQQKRNRRTGTAGNLGQHHNIHEQGMRSVITVPQP